MDSTVGLAAELSAPAPAPRLSTFTPGASANSFCDTQSEVDSRGESVRQSAVAAAAAGSSEAAGNAGPHDSKKKSSSNAHPIGGETTGQSSIGGRQRVHSEGAPCCGVHLRTVSGGDEAVGTTAGGGRGLIKEVQE